MSNNGWVDGNTADGIRKTFSSEFSDIWVYNLRGNQRTAGEVSKREGGKAFGSGARTGVAVLIAAKRPNHEGPCQLRYHGVADYQTREEKLSGIANATLANTPWETINPNAAGDWLNQRNAAFDSFPALSDDPGAHFASRSAGVQTNRDPWVYNFSPDAVEANMRRMIAKYNEEAAVGYSQGDHLDSDATQISWSSSLVPRALRGEQHAFDPSRVRRSLYRPFTKQALYFDPIFNHRPGQNARYFPTAAHENIGIWLIGPGSAAHFACLATQVIPGHVIGAGNPGIVFPRRTYERVSEEVGQGSLLETPDGDVDEWGYRRVDNITDEILAVYRAKFGPQVSKDDIFFYVYGVLHSEQYRTEFAADLKRMLPRIPLAGSREDFEAFVKAGRALSELHVGYESVEPYPLHEQAPAFGDPWQVFRVEKLRWVDKTSKKAIRVNGQVTLGDIPAAANRYMLGSRSALDWIIDRYQVKTDKASGIVNDPNDWGREHDDPRYIVDLIKRVTRVSVETMKIVDALPTLPLDD